MSSPTPQHSATYGVVLDQKKPKRSALRFNLTIAPLVWAIWLAFGGRLAVYHLFADWKIALTMVSAPSWACGLRVLEFRLRFTRWTEADGSRSIKGQSTFVKIRKSGWTGCAPPSVASRARSLSAFHARFHALFFHAD